MLKVKQAAAPCRVEFRSGRYRHAFGGPPTHQGVTPRGAAVPMHRVLTLDLADPLAPVMVGGDRLNGLPLYYPLRYGGGGGEAQYRVVGNDEIELLHLGDAEPDDEEYPFMDEFPLRPVTLEPFTYEQFRALLMAEQGQGFDLVPADRALIGTIGYHRLVQVGGRIHPMQGDLRWSCRNPACKWSGRVATLDVLARVSATPCQDIMIFGEHGTDVEIYFGLCRACGCVVTVNRCT